MAGMTEAENAARKALVENGRAVRRQIQKRPIKWSSVVVLLRDSLDIAENMHELHRHDEGLRRD